jgi:ubiquinone/menaquinone biosynthesis C-methylase UbiE
MDKLLRVVKRWVSRRLPKQWKWDTLSQFVPAQSSVLDIGCGSGEAGQWIAERQQCEVTGLETVVRPDCRIPCTKFDGHNLPFESSSFDVALLSDVLHHADDPQKLLSEAVRVSRRWVIIKDHASENSLQRWFLWAMDYLTNPPPFRYLSRRQWKDMLDSCNLVERQRRELHLGLTVFMQLEKRR